MQLLTDMKPAVMMLTSNSCSDYDHLHTTEKEYFFFINILTLTQIYVGFFIEGMYISKITFSNYKAPTFVRIEKKSKLGH